MSLDDQSPTEYHGPNAVTFIGPHGKPIRVSEEHYYRLTAAGALTDAQMLHAIVDGRSLQDILDEANEGSDEVTGPVSVDSGEQYRPTIGGIHHSDECMKLPPFECICRPTLSLVTGTGIVLPEAEHRPGCSIERTGKCICSYIAQWDER